MHIPVVRHFLPCLSFARYVVQRSLGWVGRALSTTLQIKSLSQPIRYLLTTFWNDRIRSWCIPDFFKHFSNPSLFQCLPRDFAAQAVLLQPCNQGGRFRPVGAADVEHRHTAACRLDEAAVTGFADQRVAAGEQVAETHPGARTKVFRLQCFKDDGIGMVDLPALLHQPAHAVYPRPFFYRSE